MIARMSKYDLVLYAGQSSDFIEKLRGLGLVDITTTGWEPSDEDRQLLLTIDNHHKAVETLKRFLEDERFVKDEQPIADGGEAFDRYMAATQQAAALRSEIARLQKTADELRPWGDFSVDTLRKLADKGVVLRYFFTSRAAYEKDIEAWSERYTIALVHEGETFDYFVVVTRPGEEVVLDAQEVKAPTMDCRQAEAQIAEARRKLAELDREFSRAASFGISICFFASSITFSISSIIKFVFSIASSPISVVPRLCSIHVSAGMQRVAPSMVNSGNSL